MSFEAAPLPDIDEVLDKPIYDPGTETSEGLLPGAVILDPNEDIVDKITGKVITVEKTVEREPAIPTWAWLLGGSAIAYFVFIRK